MFRITADEITYDGRRVATLRPDLNATFIDDVAELLESATPDAISEEDHNDALQEMSREHGTEVETLEARIAELEKENRLLEKDNEELERSLGVVREEGGEVILADMRAEVKRANEFAEKCRTIAIEADRKHTALLKKRGR
jgi:hypothetical protein